MKKQNILSFFDVSKNFKKKNVLDGLTLNISQGDIFGIVGESGCGKSTLFKILFDFMPLDFGHILFFGKEITKNLKMVRTRVGFATQEDTFYHKLTVAENIAYYARLYGIKGAALHERTAELLKLFKLEGYEKTLAEKLSGGMKKRLGLVISLIHDPDVFLLDEPTVGLDPILRDEIWRWIKKINDLGKTVIVISHLFEELERNCSKIAIMTRGRILVVGNADTYKRVWPEKNLNQIFESILKKEAASNV